MIRIIDTSKFKNRAKIKEWLLLNGYVTHTWLSEETYMKYLNRFSK